MSTELAVRDQQFVAVTPHDLVPAQAQLIGWCQAKIHALASELREQRQNLRQAKAMKWKHTGWLSAVAQTQKRMVYYTKIRAACQAGYLVVPNFDVDVIAVRVARPSPKHETDVREATPQLLPPGRGRYVDETLMGYETPEVVTQRDGSKRTITRFHPTDFDPDIDFPVRLVKPAVLAATDRAMALRLFDRIGIVRGGRRSDPIVVGQIIDPTKSTAYGALRQNPTCLSFFIAWWLDTKDL